MKAVICNSFGPIDSLSLENIEDVTSKEEEVEIGIKAAALNFPDVLMVEGKYQSLPKFPFSPGGEFAGAFCLFVFVRVRGCVEHSSPRAIPWKRYAVTNDLKTYLGVRTTNYGGWILSRMQDNIKSGNRPCMTIYI